MTSLKYQGRSTSSPEVFRQHGQSYQRCSEATRIGRRITPIFDERCTRQDRSDNLALNADAFAVNNPHDAKAFTMGLSQVFFHYWFHLTRRDRVLVKDIRDFNLDRFRKWIKIVVVVLHF